MCQDVHFHLSPYSQSSVGCAFPMLLKKICTRECNIHYTWECIVDVLMHGHVTVDFNWLLCR